MYNKRSLENFHNKFFLRKIIEIINYVLVEKCIRFPSQSYQILLCLCFQTFAVKLSHFVTIENNSITIKRPSLIAKNEKKFGRIDFG
jgi:hypothetical protein